MNPLRASVLETLRALDRSPWTGHRALLGTVPRPWQAGAEVLAQFGPTVRVARRRYRACVAAGVSQGRRPELQGGGLVRSLGGWTAGQARRRGREAFRGDECILGRSDFVEWIRRDLAAPLPAGPRQLSLDALVARVCAHGGVEPTHLAAGGRTRALTRARAGIASCWAEGLGRPGRPLAGVLGISPQAVYQAVARGRPDRAEWEPLLQRTT